MGIEGVEAARGLAAGALSHLLKPAALSKLLQLVLACSCWHCQPVIRQAVPVAKVSGSRAFARFRVPPASPRGQPWAPCFLSQRVGGLGLGLARIGFRGLGLRVLGI